MFLRGLLGAWEHRGVRTAVDFSETAAEKQACALSSTELAHVGEPKAISWRLLGAYGGSSFQNRIGRRGSIGGAGKRWRDSRVNRLRAGEDGQLSTEDRGQMTGGRGLSGAGESEGRPRGP